MPKMPMPVLCLVPLLACEAEDAPEAPSPAPAPAPAEEVPAEPAPEAEGASCVSVVPGERIGERFSLGTVLAEDSSVEPDALPGWHRPTDPAGHSARLRFDDSKALIEIEVPLPPCVALGDRQIETDSIHVLAAALGTCGTEAINEGGNVIACGGALLTQSLDGATLRVLAATPSAPACTAYTTGGGWADASGLHQAAGDRLELAEGAAVCLPGVEAPLVPETNLEAFKALGMPCQEEANRGATLQHCGQLTYTFAGPPLAFAAVTVK